MTRPASNEYMIEMGGLSRAGPMMLCQCRRYLHSSVGDNVIIHISTSAFTKPSILMFLKIKLT